MGLVDLDFHDDDVPMDPLERVLEEDDLAVSVMNWWNPTVDGQPLGRHRSMWIIRRDATRWEFLIPTFAGVVDHEALSDVVQSAARANGLTVEFWEHDEQTSPPDAGWLDDAVRVVVAAGPVMLTSAASIATKEALAAVARGVRRALLRRRAGDEDWRNDDGYL